MNKSKEIFLKLLNIEMIGTEISFLPDFKPVNKYDYELEVESKYDQTNKIVVLKLVVGVGVKGFRCAGQTAQFWFDVSDYEKDIKRNKDGAFEVPDNLQHHMNAIAISTARGMLYMSLKGTLLHNAILPNIDPTKL